MIKVTSRRKPGGGYSVEIKGHANAAEYGRDPVCAAVSMLALTLSERLESDEIVLAHPPVTRLANGNCLIEAYGESEGDVPLAEAFKTVEAGFRLLGENFPQLVEYRHFGEDVGLSS